jgi:hypothetical protein
MARTELTEIDRDALERCLVAARAEDPGRAKQIDSMLRSQARERVAVFACSCAQSRSLNLPPWQTPPFRINLASALREPFDDTRGLREGGEILKKMLALNISRFEPDPLKAIAEAEQRQIARNSYRAG